MAAVGADVTHTVWLGAVSATLDMRLAFEHRAGDRTPEATVSFAGGNVFDVSATEVPRDTVRLGLGVRAPLSDALSLDVSYDGQYGDGLTEQSVRGALAYRF